MKDLKDLKDLEKAVLIDRDNKDLYFFEYFNTDNEFNCIFPLGDYFVEGEDYTKLQILNNYYHEEDFLAFNELNSLDRDYILKILNKQLCYLKNNKLNPVSKEYFEKIKERIDFIIEDIFEVADTKNFILEKVMTNTCKDFVIYNKAGDYDFPHIELFSISTITDNRQGFTGELLYFCNQTSGEYAQYNGLFEDFIKDKESLIIENKIEYECDVNKYPVGGIIDFTCTFKELKDHCDIYGFKLCTFEELDKSYQEKIVESLNKRNTVFRETINANTSFLWRQSKATKL